MFKGRRRWDDAYDNPAVVGAVNDRLNELQKQTVPIEHRVARFKKQKDKIYCAPFTLAEQAEKTSHMKSIVISVTTSFG